MREHDGVLEADCPAQRQRLRFDRAGVTLEHDAGHQLSLQLSALGRGAALQPAPSAEPPRAEGKRVSYRRGAALTEW